MDTIVCAVSDETSVNNSMGRNFSQATRPPLFKNQRQMKISRQIRDSAISKSRTCCSTHFGWSLSWAVDHKLIRLGIKSGGCLKSLNIRAMTKLSLCITPNNLHLIGQRQPFLLLLLCTLPLDSRHKHSLEKKKNMNWRIKEETINHGGAGRYPVKINKGRLINKEPQPSCFFLCNQTTIKTTSFRSPY